MSDVSTVADLEPIAPLSGYMPYCKRNGGFYCTCDFCNRLRIKRRAAAEFDRFMHAATTGDIIDLLEDISRRHDIMAISRNEYPSEPLRYENKDMLEFYVRERKKGGPVTEFRKQNRDRFVDLKSISDALDKYYEDMFNPKYEPMDESVS